MIAAGALAQRAHGDDHGITRRADRNLHADRCAQRGRPVGIVDARANHRVAGRRIDARVDGDDARGNRLRRVAGVDLHAVADASSRGDGLRDVEVDVYRVADALERREQGAGLEELADVDIRQSDACSKRRANGLSCDDRLRALDLRERDVALGPGVVELDLRCGPALRHAVHAREQCFGQSGLRLLCLELGLLDRDVERDEQRAFLDDPPRREVDVLHRAGQLVAKGDRAQREDGSDGGHRLPVFALDGDGGGHGFDGLGLHGGRFFGFDGRGVLPGGEDERDRDDRGEQEERVKPAARDRGGGDFGGGRGLRHVVGSPDRWVRRTC